MHLITTSSR